jgi:hypothetical protein
MEFFTYQDPERVKNIGVIGDVGVLHVPGSRKGDHELHCGAAMQRLL